MSNAKSYITILLISLLCCCPIAVKAQQDFLSERDSLQRVIPTLRGEAKLDAYAVLSNNYFMTTVDEASLNELLAVLEAFRKEAAKQGNDAAIAFTIQNKVDAYYNLSMWDAVETTVRDNLDYLYEKKLWRYYFNVYQALLELYLYNGQIARSIEEADKMYRVANDEKNVEGQMAALFTIGSAYSSQKRTDKAMEFYRQCIVLQKKGEKISNFTTYAYHQLSKSLLEKKEFDAVTQTLKEWEAAIEQREKTDRARDHISRENLYTTYANLYVYLENFEEALRYCDLAEKEFDTLRSKINLASIRAQIYNGLHMHDKALEQTEFALKYFPEQSALGMELLMLKASSLANLGRACESYAAAELAYQMKDTLLNSDFNARLDELRTQYEVEQHIAEKKITRLQLSFALVGCLLLLVALGIYIRYSIRLKRKNAALFDQIQEMTQVAEKAEIQFNATPDASLSREMQLFRRINDLMRQSKPFTDQELTRKTLADLLNTNESYLADAIREGTGLTFSNYIAELRLHYSLALLADKLDMTLEAVAVDTGFGSYSPFYRAFIKKYGINPSEYRRLSMQKSRSTTADESVE